MDSWIKVIVMHAVGEIVKQPFIRKTDDKYEFINYTFCSHIPIPPWIYNLEHMQWLLDNSSARCLVSVSNISSKHYKIHFPI